MAIRDAYDGKREEMMKRIYPLFCCTQKSRVSRGEYTRFSPLQFYLDVFFYLLLLGERESERETQ